MNEADALKILNGFCIISQNGIETGALTEEKFKTLGTPEAVRRTFMGHFHRPDPELSNVWINWRKWKKFWYIIALIINANKLSFLKFNNELKKTKKKQQDID